MADCSIQLLAPEINVAKAVRTQGRKDFIENLKLPTQILIIRMKDDTAPLNRYVDMEASRQIPTFKDEQRVVHHSPVYRCAYI